MIFSLDGLGLLGFQAAIDRDYPIMFGTLYIYTLIGLAHESGAAISPTCWSIRASISRRAAHERRLAAARPGGRWLGLRITPLTRRRLANFRANRRGFWSLWIFLALFAASLFAEFIANDRPLARLLSTGISISRCSPIIPRPTFGGEFPTEADYRDPYRQTADRSARLDGLAADPVPLRHHQLRPAERPRPRRPTAVDWLGTDDQGRDVLARLIYGFRISVLFGLTLTSRARSIGVAAGAIQGYYGGLIDLLVPALHRDLVGPAGALPAHHPVQHRAAEFLVAARHHAAVLAGCRWSIWCAPSSCARAISIMCARRRRWASAIRSSCVRHVLPNAMVATLTFMPFILNGSITTLTSLDFLGFGLPPGSPSLGELLPQGKNNLQAPWLGLTGFFVLAVMLSLLIFIGEAVRDAFDPRKIGV